MKTLINPIQESSIQQTIQNFEDYIKNADHSEPATLNLIIEDGLTSDELDSIELMVKDFESFEIFNSGEQVILSNEQLENMLSDLKNYSTKK
ncbi:MAG TPA: hypothetical protein PLL09_04585 [Flavobacterium sp.]|uniref:hypothetical protein n=1 Tax=unclassified Flavobacterium TaxID=196869 RepID=UPI0025B8847A|nr:MULTISPECIES: hypothetical protein [unclassified Flavobacterium]HRE77085.1 hypothetical protein [Flavobacterium sp.]